MPENDESEFEIVVTPEMIGAGLSALEICGASADDHFLVAAVYTAMERERGAIIYLRKHESPATAPSSEGNAQDGLTQKVSSLLFPYLRAWTDQAEIGDPAFDECATVESLADLLAARVVRLLRTEI